MGGGDAGVSGAEAAAPQGAGGALAKEHPPHRPVVLTAPENPPPDRQWNNPFPKSGGVRLADLVSLAKPNPFMGLGRASEEGAGVGAAPFPGQLISTPC